jgi:hypothetical protein
VAERAAIAWFALRELREGATPTFERLAAATGRTVETLRNRAKREAWGELAGRIDDDDRRARLGRLTDWIIEILEAVKKGVSEEGAPIEKTKIEAISALMRTVEKLGEVTRSTEGAKENQIKRDARTAGVLKRIDQRIVELATEYAKQLGSGKPDDRGG